jgi:nitrogen fixation protein NifB
MLGEDRSQQFLFTPTETAPTLAADITKTRQATRQYRHAGESDEADACLVAVASTET